MSQQQQQHIPKNILIVGATGLLGSQIANEITKNKLFNITILTRKENQDKNKNTIESLKSNGAKIAEGDASNIDSVVSALKENQIDTILSVVSSSQVDVQFNLVEAAKKSEGNVKRIIPSEFGFDSDLLPSDTFFASKVQVQKAIESAGFDYTYIFTGGFYEFLTSPIFGFDHEKGELEIPGNGHEVFITIHTSDIAKYIPEILLDPFSRNNKIVIQGQRTTFNDMIKIFESVSGKKFKVNYTSGQELLKLQDEAQGLAKFPFHLKYLNLFAGNTKFDHSSRYSVVPITLKDFALSIYKK